MKKILTITLGLLTVFSLFAQNANEELNGKMLGNSAWYVLTQGDYDSSIVVSRRSLGFDSTLSYVHFNIALAYLLKGENEISQKEYTYAIKRAERFGLAKETLLASIKDIIDYMDRIPSKSIAENIIQTIKNTVKEYEITTTIFFHVPKIADSINPYKDFGFGRTLDGIKVSTIDSSGSVFWTSEKITDFVEDSSQYAIKVEIPQIVLVKSRKTECLYLYSELINKGGSKQSLETLYYFVNRSSDFSNIKLNLISTPKGAEIFLIPNRVWMKEFDGKKWQSYGETYMVKFRVNGTTTNTFTHIDETVYVVLFKLKDDYKLRTLYTKPAQIAPEQTVTITF